MGRTQKSLRERTQTQKISYCMIMEVSRKGNSIETESRLLVAYCWMWEWGVTANGNPFSFWGDGSVLKLGQGNCCTTL